MVGGRLALPSKANSLTDRPRKVTSSPLVGIICQQPTRRIGGKQIGKLVRNTAYATASGASRHKHKPWLKSPKCWCSSRPTPVSIRVNMEWCARAGIGNVGGFPAVEPRSGLPDHSFQREAQMSASWQRWFAWRPVHIIDRWYWLTYVARDQWTNKPSRYRYARYKKQTLPRQT